MDATPRRKYKKHKQGYTISVTHVLRKDKNFLEKLLSKEEPDGVRKLPIYVRVSFLQQTAIMRSRLKQMLTEDEFESYTKRPDIARFIDDESAAIRLSIDEFGPDKVDGFKISQWTEYYNKWNVSIKEVVGEWVTERIKSQIKKDYELGYGVSNEQDGLIDATLTLISSSLSTVQMLATIQTPIAKGYVERYPSLFRIDDYEGKSKHNNNVIFTLWDWKSGAYEGKVRDLHGNDATEYLNLVSDILANYNPDS